jgi:chorismate synthase
MNTLGSLFAVTSFGESHGTYVGCVIDGCVSNLALNVEEIQQQVDRRKASISSFSTQRLEEDKVEIISGLYNNKTLGSPITILIKNKDVKSSDYEALKNVYRPNHADFTNEKKYGHRDERGGGRTSIRVTAPLVAAGDIARQFLQQKINYSCTAFVKSIGGIGLANELDHNTLDFSKIDSSEVRCPDENSSKAIVDLIEKTKEEGDTLGGIITCVIKLDTIGLGEPIFNKLQAQLAHAMFSINTVKGFEYGMGFESAAKKGSEYNDEFVMNNEIVKTKTNRSGGIQGGISNGMEIYFNVSFKPISSIKKEQQTVNNNNENVQINIEGRHDVCAVPRAVPIVEAYVNMVMADMFLHFLKNK